MDGEAAGEGSFEAEGAGEAGFGEEGLGDFGGEPAEAGAVEPKGTEEEDGEEISETPQAPPRFERLFGLGIGWGWLQGRGTIAVEEGWVNPSGCMDQDDRVTRWACLSLLINGLDRLAPGWHGW